MKTKCLACMMAVIMVSPTWAVAQGSKANENGKKELNLTDLGFSEKELAPDLSVQTRLEDRRFYLRQHQIWGLVAAGAIGAAILSGGEGDLPPEHPFLAGLAVASYGAAAYTSWMAPELPSASKQGGSLWHRRLMWIHLPGMIATPILGYMAAKKIERGEKLDGPEKYHKDVGIVTGAVLALSAITVSFEF